jgi:hypothetical protein
MIRQAFGEEWAVHGESELSKTEKGETSEKQSKEHAHNFIWH